MRTRNVFLLGLAGLARAVTLHAADEDPSMMMMGDAAKLDPKQIEFFEKKVQPILKDTCYKCHSVEAGKSKGDLTLDTREGLMKGGKNGAVVKDRNGNATPGRDHNGRAFSTWMAGGGVKGGTTYGSTDEFGSRAAENKVHVHDLHATILALMGFDHTKLTYRYKIGRASCRERVCLAV